MQESSPSASNPGDGGSPLQGYYEWQVATLMLAYDLADPITPGDEQRVNARREAVAQEVGELVRGLLPPEYLANPEKDFSPELMMQITRETLRRAVQIAGV